MIVILRPVFGTANAIKVTVDGFGTKNGKDLVEYGDSWAYVYQIDRVLTF